MDIRVVAVRASQAELHAEIERLSAGKEGPLILTPWTSANIRVENSNSWYILAELQLLLSTADPPALEPAIARLTNVRKRLTTAAATLKIVQERLERVHAAAVARSVGLA